MPKNHHHGRRNILIVVSVFVLGCVALGVAVLLYGFSDQPSRQWGMVQVQKLQEARRVGFENYLKGPTAPNDKQELEQFIRETYGFEKINGDQYKTAEVLGYDYDRGEAHLDLMSTHASTLSGAGGLTNKNFTFIMCTRLSGKASPDAKVAAVDIPCEGKDNAQMANDEVAVTLDDKPSWLYRLNELFNRGGM